jgi:uncharacterized protein (TIGR02246 family)
MSESERTVAQAFVRAINRQDPDALANLMTEDHRFTDALANVVEGREKMRAAWAAYFRIVPDYTVAVEETYNDGPVVVMLAVVGGTYVHPSGKDLSPGTPNYAPGGQLKPENRWKTPAALRAVIEDDKVSEWRVYADNDPIRRLMA